ncbi:hypothetical protein BDA96_01G325600 [Sorghum bicolor]|uniref:Bifunctional inhibitor/plant lipid transfer protein/seed storage helical domain-containing protein n=2 Tax=Sorghum bicolor TaxID=4558 RepID=A0A921S2C3_SORBI|nr:putative lipid-binding protein AIR1 [Sorghum bicolor]EER91967.1 hypothetical protein SORBI_3001G304300 [Sorghum bicolor]KAG0550281.1 hypothetical protein BDA96_01G325600 [Sorghum bicolor]|eukprot:XP_002464969.1 putative lipid-binding protein AIR1 [Sorghum bicolor]
MAVPRRNGSSATALAAVLALGHFLLLATHSVACGSSSCPKPAPPPPCSPTTPKARGGGGARCPVNALKLGACASVLGGLVSLELGQQQRPATSSTQPCCQLLGGLADLDAAVCLCTALRANVLGVVQLRAHVELSVLVNYCGKKLPQGFQCARAN